MAELAMIASMAAIYRIKKKFQKTESESPFRG
jgi:hypothetical protein